MSPPLAADYERSSSSSRRRRSYGSGPCRLGSLEAGVAASLELDDLGRALVLVPLGLRDRPDEVQMAVHLVSSHLYLEGRRDVGAPCQRAPRREVGPGLARRRLPASSVPG